MVAVAKEKQKLYSVEEYFELELNSEVRHEFHFGKITPMAGESTRANKIANNIYFNLRQIFKGQGYDYFTHDVKLMTMSGFAYRYPDLVMTKAENVEEYIVTEPTLIVEVLSASTEKIDMTKKVIEYTKLNSLKYYLLVSQDERSVQVYERNDGKWSFEVHDKDSMEISLKNLNATLSLSAIYEEIEFEEN